MSANGALELKGELYKYAVDRLADAISKQPVVPSIVIGGGGQTPSSLAIMDMLQVKLAKELALDMSMPK